jgi:hypothetical protein
MSRYDKTPCAREGCNHPRYEHIGSHKKGRRTMCLRQVGEHHTDKCTCLEFLEPVLEQQSRGASKPDH